MGEMKEKIKKFPFTSKRSKDDIIFHPKNGNIPLEFMRELLDKFAIPSGTDSQSQKLEKKQNLEIENLSLIHI